MSGKVRGLPATRHLLFANMAVGDEVLTDTTCTQARISRAAKRLGFKFKSYSYCVDGIWAGYCVRRVA